LTADTLTEVGSLCLVTPPRITRNAPKFPYSDDKAGFLSIPSFFPRFGMVLGM
jgi:hypothetical protein